MESQRGAAAGAALPSSRAQGSTSGDGGGGGGGGGGRAEVPRPATAKSMTPVALRRLQKEFSEWHMSSRTSDTQPLPPIYLETPVQRLDEWYIGLRGADSTLYAGEAFRLRFRFPTDYPIESPEVVFVGTTPLHEHVYSNGHLCLSILYDSWSPALTVNSVALSIQSMLSSATEKRRPPDNDAYVRNCRGRSPKQTRWLFHDDGV
ncbi:hypothetical protein CDCA_CDCA03G1146 [Cyanidium caldarium]|uniref:UBC core domain-containing protein n=1 Tax=Cyanidium caldarium TaxID=2771 RepID=A0AAV9IST6_CYACA|nr:hypothetical protein CDCA_CDCA03G1146 [Cyanidium caldarium]